MAPGLPILCWDYSKESPSPNDIPYFIYETNTVLNSSACPECTFNISQRAWSAPDMQHWDSAQQTPLYTAMLLNTGKHHC